MVKILFVHQNLEVGGAEKLRYSMLKHLNRAKYAADICCLGVKGQLGSQIEDLGYTVHSFCARINLCNPVLLYKLYRLIRKGKYDVVQSALFYANYYSRIAAFIAGVKVVLAEEHGIYQWKSKHKVFIVIDRILSRVTTRVIACSETVRRFTLYQERIPGDKVVTIHNFVDSCEARSPLSKLEARTKLRLPESAFLMAIIGSFRAEKGHKYLFQALARLKFSDYKLLVVGGGPLDRLLKESVSQLGVSDKVLFLNNSSRIPDIMSAIDILVIPSESEGLPITLLEAMSCSVPIVASKVSGIKEVLVNNKTGILVPRRNADRLSSALTYLRENPGISQGLGEASEAVVKARHSSSIYFEKLEKLYGLAYA